MAHLEGADVEELDADDVRGAEPDGEGVSVDDVLRVLSHGQNLMSAHPNRFQWSCRSRDEYREVCVSVPALCFSDDNNDDGVCVFRSC